MPHSMIITPNPQDPEVVILTEEFHKLGFQVECLDTVEKIDLFITECV